MNHLSEEELILHYYGEQDTSPAAEEHLAECAECRALFASFQRVLNAVDSLPVPERSAGYEADLWQRLSARLTRRRWSWPDPRPAWGWALACAGVVALVATGFLAGRYYPRPDKPEMVAVDRDARERILLAAVGECLERSQMVLVELANASTAQPLDITSEQERAAELISESRLYRQTAAATGNGPVADLLEELERVLLDVARGPSSLSPAQIGELRQRLDAEGILFKIRVVDLKVRDRQESPEPGTPRRSL